ncbi:MAG TPA: helix-turn-helix domain-containing protein [Solirubrobacteraceae bacterium]
MSAATLLRQARTTAGLTQAELGARLGVTQPVIARLESAGSNPTYATLERALRVTGHGLALAGRPALPTAAVDLSQLRERLALTPEERLRLFTGSQRNLAALAGRARRRAG